MSNSISKNERIEYLKLAIAANESGIRKVMSEAKEGMDLERICSIFSSEVRIHGATWYSQRKEWGYGGPFIVDERGVGPKKRIEGKLARNRLWGVDFIVQYQGYYADLGRYGFIGTPPYELLEKYREIIRTQDAIASLIKPRRLAEDVYEACKHLPYKYEVHGIGRECHEDFTFGTFDFLKGDTRRAKEKKTRFKLNSIICIELWDGFNGGGEDEYIITEEGTQKISTLPRKIYIQK